MNFPAIQVHLTKTHARGLLDYYELSLFCENNSDDRPMIDRHNRIYTQASDAVSILIVAPYKRWNLSDFQVEKCIKGILSSKFGSKFNAKSRYW